MKMTKDVRRGSTRSALRQVSSVLSVRSIRVEGDDSERSGAIGVRVPRSHRQRRRRNACHRDDLPPFSRTSHCYRAAGTDQATFPPETDLPSLVMVVIQDPIQPGKLGLVRAWFHAGAHAWLPEATQRVRPAAAPWSPRVACSAVVVSVHTLPRSQHSEIQVPYRLRRSRMGRTWRSSRARDPPGSCCVSLWGNTNEMSAFERSGQRVDEQDARALDAVVLELLEGAIGVA